MKLVVALIGLAGLYHLLAMNGSATAAAVITGGMAAVAMVIASLMYDA
jgi:hypothetical protein